MLDVSMDRQRLETLIEINTLINSNYTDLRGLLTRIVESATLLSDGEASSLLLVNPENNKLYFEIALGSKSDEVKRISLDMGEGVAGWVAQNNKSVIVNDTDQDQRHAIAIARSVGFPAESILAVPMRVKDRCVGVIEIINKNSGGRFSEADLQWLEVFATQAAIAIQNARSYQMVQEQALLLGEQVQQGQGFHTFVGVSRLIKEKLAIAERAASTSSSVLLLGESGVGKELFAEQIHLRSQRRQKPFLRVNCAAIPESLLESELFGHVKGAFTDATRDRRGRFELADEGTLFLDEIGEVPLAVQAKLLRVLQQKTLEKVGSSQSIQVDVRIIAATNRDIEAAVEQQTFRKDLYYRLNVLPITIPPLRERREDIPVLADHFLKRFKREMAKNVAGFSEEAMQALLSHDWPGNVRELENAVERALVIGREEYLQAEDLVLSRSSSEKEYQGKSFKEAVNLFRKHFIASSLDRHSWNQTKTARSLGLQRTYLSRLIKDLGIAKD